MTIATALLAVLAFAIILWQETLLRKREQTIEVLREEIALLHEQRCRSIPSPPVRFLVADRTAPEPPKP